MLGAECHEKVVPALDRRLVDNTGEIRATVAFEDPQIREAIDL